MIAALGNEVSFEMSNGKLIEIPPFFWITVDGDGKRWRACDVMILPTFKVKRMGALPYDRFLAGSGPPYFQPPPSGDSWIKLGKVKQILYTRPDQGGKFHLFDKQAIVVLYGHGSKGFYRLVLPTGCEVNYRGFVTP